MTVPTTVVYGILIAFSLFVILCGPTAAYLNKKWAQGCQTANCTNLMIPAAASAAPFYAPGYAKFWYNQYTNPNPGVIADNNYSYIPTLFPVSSP